MKKRHITLFAVMILLSCATVLGAWRLYDVPLTAQAVQVEKKAQAQKAQYERYLDAQETGTSESKNVRQFPAAIRQQDQLLFLALLERQIGFSADTVRFAERSTALDGGISYRKLTFSYRVPSYEIFCRMISAIHENEHYPSAVENFTLRQDKEGALYGEMHIRNYYAPDKADAYSFTAPAVPTGNAGLFRRQTPQP